MKIKTNSLLCWVVVQEKPFPHLTDDTQFDNYYTGADGRFSADIRRAKLYPTDRAARRSYPFTQELKYPPPDRWKRLTTHEVRLEY